MPGPATYRITGRISGTGELIKGMEGTLFIAGSQANTFTGSFRAAEGLAVLAKPAGVAALACADVTAINGGIRIDANEQIVNTARLHVLENGSIDLNGKTETVASLELESGTVSGGNSPSLLIVSGNVTTLASANPAQLNVNARITGAPTVLNVADGSAADDFVSTVSLHGAAGSSLRKTGAGRAVLNEFTGSRPVEIQQGELAPGSAAGSSITLNGGTLTGDSTINQLTSAAGGGTVAPGDGVGTIFCTNVALNAATTFAVQIQSTAPGGFDVLDSNFGTVSLGGATLALQVLPGFSGGVGAPVVILDNDGADAITGTFAGLPEGAEVVQGAVRFRISYVGGTGNDVTLSLVSVPPTGITRTWTGGAANDNIDQAANWNPAVVPNAGDRMLFPSGPADRDVIDNIPGATPYDALIVAGTGYSFTGSGIALLDSIRSAAPSGETAISLPILLADDALFLTTSPGRIVVFGAGLAAIDLAGHELVFDPQDGGIDIGVDMGALNPIDGIFGAGAVVKYGTGTLTLKCANSYTGPTTINGGTVRVQHGSGLGAAGAGNETTVAAAAELQLAGLGTGVVSVAENVILNGELSSTESNGAAGNTLSGTVTMAANEVVQVLAGQLALTGVVQGAGAPIVQGAGEVFLGGAAANTFTGETTVFNSTLSLQKPAGVAAIGTGAVHVTGASTLRLLASDQIAGNVFVKPGAVFALNGFNETVPQLIAENASVTGAGSTLTVDTLLGTAPISTATSTVACNVRASGASLTLSVVDAPVLDDLIVSGAISSVPAGATLRKTSGGRAVLSGANTIANLQIDTGSVMVNGASGAMAVQLNGGTLGGTGTVGTITSTGGGSVAPGTSAGTLHSGALAWNAATNFAVELQTPAAGTGHDQLRVTGTVNLGGATLNAIVLAGFAATPADTFLILENDGADAIVGTFAGLPQNATFSAAGKTFRISYTGGTGNDVTLQPITLGTGVTRTWDGGGGVASWTTPQNWVGDVVPAAGDDLVFPQTAAQKTNNNNFPPNTAFNSIRVAGSGYTITGNAVALNDGVTFDFASGLSECGFSIVCSQAQTFAALNGARGTLAPAVALNNAGFPVTLHADAAARLDVSALFGTGSLTKTGAGTVGLTANTYTGATSILAGDVVLETFLTGLGGTAEGTTVAAGAKLRIDTVGAGALAEPITLGGVLAFVDSPVSVTGGVVLSGADVAVVDSSGPAPTISSVISGGTGLRKIGAGAVTFSGAAANTFSGGLFVEAGAVLCAKTAGVNAAPGPITIGDGTATTAVLRLTNPNQIPTVLVTLNGAGALFDLNGQAETVGALALTGSTITTGGATLSFSGLLNTFASATSATITGNLTSTAGGIRAWTIQDGAAADDLVTSGVIAGPVGMTIAKQGEGRVVLGGNSNFTKLRLDFGTAAVNGVCAGMAVDLGPFGNNEATLTGSGITGPVATPSIVAGKIAPSGILTASGNTSWNAETRLQIRLLNTTPGAGHDQYSVLGTPTLGGAQLEVTLQPGFVPFFGNTFKILDNNGSGDAVVGTFAGLAEGALLDVSGTKFRISYIGGDGNDVTLTVGQLPATGTTRVWDGGSGVDANWMTAANWVGDVAPVAGDALDFPAGAAQRNNTNNFPANTTFESIRIAGDSYFLNGTNAVVLNSGLRAELGIGTATFTPPIVLAAAQTFTAMPGASVVLSGAVATGGHTLTLDTVDLGIGGGLIFLQGVVSGAGALEKTGGGVLFLAGNNTFTGPANIAAGFVQVGHNNAFGSTAAGTTVQSGVALQFNQSGLTLAENFTLAQFAQIASLTGTNTFTGTLTLAGPGAITISCTTPVVLSGVIAGPGSFFKTLGADLTISGTAANTFTGGLVVSTGAVLLQKTAGVVALPGPVWVGDATGTEELRLLNANQIADTATVAVFKSGTFNLNNLAETIARLELTEGTVSTDTGTLAIDGTLETFAAPNTSTLTGNVAVKAPLATDTRTWTIADGAATDDLTVNAVISAIPAGVKLETTGPGRTRFTAANTISDIVVTNGTALFTGSNTGTTIRLNGGTLAGTGTVSGIASDAGGTVAPGASPGILSAASKVTWNPTTTFAVELSSLGTYDRLNAEGPIDLGNAALTVSLGFTALPGDTFLILRNIGSDPIDGTFAGLPEGAFLSAPGAHIFRITYVGNDGNDIELTRVAGISPKLTFFNKVPGTGPTAGLDEVTLTASATPFLSYQLETSTDLNVWTTQYTETANTITGVLNFQFTQPQGIPAMFYRVRLP
jgi:autotransporter-associated beta strand protein